MWRNVEGCFLRQCEDLREWEETKIRLQNHEGSRFGLILWPNPVLNVAQRKKKALKSLKNHHFLSFCLLLRKKLFFLEPHILGQGNNRHIIKILNRNVSN